jgi:hypothetical protein
MSSAAGPCAAVPPTVTAQYETLRMAALGEAVPPEARSGLMLFLSQGMWAWARMLAAQSIRVEPSLPPSPTSAPSERDAVVRVLAAMAITVQDRSAP